ncbi:hypothetical protein EDB92DRAFT_1849866 [Lactarius akahatsu]|uniref:Secreted protein n=1 Tax=Lactarius akahatsu TaxID=416441 RepID=A0AAD4LJ56_9AGAM|nr:hypothetical protein EDB92DRAFT_1849866 [Lactarius akahatsu]
MLLMFQILSFARVPALRALTIHPVFERLSHEEGLATIHVPRRALFGRADRRQFRNSAFKRKRATSTHPAGCLQHKCATTYLEGRTEGRAPRRYVSIAFSGSSNSTDRSAVLMATCGTSSP